ncbi:polymorphic transmembrane cluster 2 transmembrane protein 11, partial [Biomphalaria glabrata]
TEEIKGTVTYRHTEIENGDYYLSSCYFRSENPENGSYYVNVTMYPNITGTEGDIKYGKTSAFQTQ